MNNNRQIDRHGRLRHFLSIEGLNSKLLTDILDAAESFSGVTEQTVKKVPLLRGKTIVNLFFEASTRTRTTFELAYKAFNGAGELRFAAVRVQGKTDKQRIRLPRLYEYRDHLPVRFAVA